MTFILQQCLSGLVLHNSLLHLLPKNCDFLNTDISQGSVATHLVFGGKFKYSFVTNFLLSLTLKEFWKSVNIWWSHGKEFGVLFFWDTVYFIMDWDVFPLISELSRGGSASPSNTQGDVTSQSPWSRYNRHFVGITRYNWQKFIVLLI